MSTHGMLVWNNYSSSVEIHQDMFPYQGLLPFLCFPGHKLWFISEFILYDCIFNVKRIKIESIQKQIFQRDG